MTYLWITAIYPGQVDADHPNTPANTDDILVKLHMTKMCSHPYERGQHWLQTDHGCIACTLQRLTSLAEAPSACALSATLTYVRRCPATYCSQLCTAQCMAKDACEQQCNEGGSVKLTSSREGVLASMAATWAWARATSCCAVLSTSCCRAKPAGSPRRASACSKALPRVEHLEGGYMAIWVRR